MKRRVACAAVLFMAAVLVGGCAAKDAPKGGVAVYGFSGECEAFEIVGGVIVDTPDKDTFYGGEMRWKGDAPQDVYHYEATFTLGGETMLCNAAQDNTGGALAMNQRLGTIEGEDVLGGGVNGALLLTLETERLGGERRTYEAAMDVRKITLDDAK